MRRSFLLTLLTPALALLGLTAAAPTAAQTAGPASPRMRLCTASEDGNYFRAGHVLKAAARTVAVDVLTTGGSLDNLDRVVEGSCDAAFVQADSLIVYSARNGKSLSTIERAGRVFREKVHLLCNRGAGVASIYDLSKRTRVAVGGDGAGGRTTMAALALADKARFGDVPLDDRSGVGAVSAVADGSEDQCMLWVGAVGAPLMRSDAQSVAERVVLVDSDVKTLVKSALDPRGQPVYSYGKIAAEKYPRIAPSGTFFGRSDVDTTDVDAVLVVSKAFIAANPRAYEGFLRTFNNAVPEIRAKVGASE